MKMKDERDARLESRFEDMDYVEDAVGRIVSDMSDCLDGKCQKPDVLYLVSENHCVTYCQTLLINQLNGSEIKVRTSLDERVPIEEIVWSYDLDKGKWISY